MISSRAPEPALIFIGRAIIKAPRIKDGKRAKCKRAGIKALFPSQRQHGEGDSQQGVV